MIYRPMMMFDEESTTGGVLDVPEIPMAGNAPAVEEVNIGVDTTAAAVADRLPGIQGPKEALGEDPNDEMADMEAQMTGKQRLRRGTDGKFLPRDKVKDDEPTKHTEPKKPEAKAPVKSKPLAQTPKAPVKPVESAQSKFKIGDQEKTAEEWAKHFKELEDKAKPKEDSKPVEQPKPDAQKTEAKPEEEETARRAAFIDSAAQKYAPTEDEFDIILSGGKNAVQLFAKKLAQVELEARKFLCEQFNAQLQIRDSELRPVLEQHSQLSQYRAEQSFLDANPEIKSHPEGVKVARETAQRMHQWKTDLAEKVRQGTASEEEQGWALIARTQTQEKFMSDVAWHTKAELAKLKSVAPSSTVAPPLKPQAPKTVVTQRPFNGDRPGTSSSPAVESEQSRHIREMEAAGR